MKDAPQFFKSFYTLEVLSDRSTALMDMHSIVQKCMSGEFSGRWQQQQHTRITPHDAALTLIGQGSDPGFLLGDDAWKYQLQRGDSAVWHPAGSDRPKRRGKIVFIEHCLDHCLVQWIHHEPVLTVSYDDLYPVQAN